MHYLLRLLVKRDAAAVILFGARGIDQLFKRLIAPFGGVGAAVGGGTAEQRTKEVIRVAGGGGPAHQRRLMFAVFHALQVLAPLIADDARLDADGGPVRLDHLRHAARVGVIGTLHRHRPEIDGGAGLNARLLQQSLRLLRVPGVILQPAVAAPDIRRQQVFRHAAGAVKNGVDDCWLIDRQGERLTHFNLIQRRFLRVKGEKAGVQP